MMLLISVTMGFVLGLIYFTMLCLGTRRALGHPRWAMLLVAGRMSRLVLFAVVFVAVSRGGITQSVAMLAAFLVGRQYVLTRVRGADHGW